MNQKDIDQTSTNTASPEARHGATMFVLVPVCITLVIVIALFLKLSAWEHDRVKLRLEHDAASLAHKLESAIASHLEALHGIQSFYASSDNIEREEFRTFVARQLVRYPGIQALEWIPRVPDTKRAAFETAARQNGHAQFQFTQRQAQGEMVRAKTRSEYFPVYYVEPYKGNETAFGFDLASNPTRLEALNVSRDTGEPIATARITLVQETGKQFGFLVFVPIYKNGLPHETVSQRRQNLGGFALGVFRIGDMVSAAGSKANQGNLALRLYDDGVPADQRLLYENDVAVTNDSKALAWTTNLGVAGRAWSLRFSPSSSYLAQHRPWGAWGVLLGGALFAGLLGAFLLSLTTHAAKAKKLVSERTSDLSKANTTLKAREAELARSNAELQQFAYIASHDLKEPLRKIIAFGDRLAAKCSAAVGDQGRDYLSRMQNAALRMQTLIDDLLAFSRVTSKTQPFAQVDLNETVQGVLSDLETSIEQANGTVEVDELPTIDADPTQMRQLLQNLIGNALKFRHPDAPPHVNVQATILDHHNGDDQARHNGEAHCQITIQDNGVGFDPKHSERIFEVFQRLHGRGEYDGAGVGLAICRKIAERHGGNISANSTPGQGATFVVTIPTEHSTKGEVQ